MQDTVTLGSLAAITGVNARTIRSWVARQLVPGPVNRGPSAVYPAGAVQRVLAVKAMRDEDGLSLDEIRQALLVATPEQLAERAATGAAITPEPTADDVEDASDRLSALQYLRALKQQRQSPSLSSVVREPAAPYHAAPRRVGFEALEHHLSSGGTRQPLDRRSRAESWLRVPVTPDVEFSVRGELTDEQRAGLERAADLIRDILFGRDQ